MSDFLKAFYRVTALYPRLMPTNKEEFEHLKQILIEAFGLEDKPEIWYTIGSQLQGAGSTTIRKSYKSLADAGRKYIINQTAQDQKLIAGEQIEAKLKEKVQKVADEFKAEEERNAPRLVSEIPEPDGSEVSDRTHRL